MVIGIWSDSFIQLFFLKAFARMRSKKVIKCTFGDILFISLYSGEPVGSINWIGDYLA